LDLIQQLAPDIDGDRGINQRQISLGAQIELGCHVPASRISLQVD